MREDETVINLHIWRRKTVLFYALHEFFYLFLFLYISQSFLSHERREMTCFAVVRTTWWCTWRLIIFLIKYKFNSRVIGTNFASMMTAIYREIIAEKWRYIFPRRFSYQRRRPCLSPLLRSALQQDRAGNLVWQYSSLKRDSIKVTFILI